MTLEQCILEACKLAIASLGSDYKKMSCFLDQWLDREAAGF